MLDLSHAGIKIKIDQEELCHRKPHVPLMMSGLLWLLVVLEGQESESDSLGKLTETTTSLLLTGGFSWDDSSSSTGTNGETDTVHAV